MLTDCARCGLIDWDGRHNRLGDPICPCCGRCVHIEEDEPEDLD